MQESPNTRRIYLQIVAFWNISMNYITLCLIVIYESPRSAQFLGVAVADITAESGYN